ncbi:alpha/beta hydrolase [Bacteroidota bacterium]
MRKLILIALLPLLSSCIRLDSLVFIGDNTITSYQFDKYEGEVEMEFPDNITVPDSLIHLITFESKMDNEETGLVLYGEYIGDLSKVTSDTIILYCHGQTDHMDYYWHRTTLLGQLNKTNHIAVFTFDYRGYGLSEGATTEDGMYADVRGALNWLKIQGVKSEQVIMYGFSLGSAPATDAAAYYEDLKPFKLILESPFASADNLTQVSTIINTSAKYFLDMKIEVAEKIKEVDQPLFWMHGTMDDYINIENGELVYRNHKGSYKEALRVEGAKHGSDGVPETMGFEEYLAVVRSFILR